MADNQLSFKISTGLKNIIGRDLITDDYVAVFELVKNSFDAYAKKVVVTFKKDKIVITDDGKGMDINDIKNKWLFVAYSAKKEGVEDLELKEKEFDSYRDKIQAKKFFAGAKGIGRFSCDRLGSKLILTSKKSASNAKIEQIVVDWNDFDKDPEEKFIDIKVKHRTLQPATKELKKLQNGTILEISNLNSSWNRTKKLVLKHSLEKLINPFEDNPLNGFSIQIEDESELITDKTEKNKRDKINGEVKNFVFETLDLKTTQVLTELDSKGEFVTTTLWDRGVLIYKIKRKNKTIPKLANISFRLFHLNRKAKLNFTKLMGLEPIHFGSVFLYKNGFRIAPYGDVGFDYFGLDTRKTQKHFDLLGSRDLIGRIEIVGSNENFKESSSRDGGLVRNEYYHSLVKCFIDECLKKLENYLNKVQWTNKEDKDNEDLSALNNILAKSALLKLISDEVDDDETLLLDADKQNLNIRAREIINNASAKDLEALKVISEKLGDNEFGNETIITLSEFEKVQLEKEEVERKLKEEEEARKKAEDELEAERKESLFHKKLAGTDIKEVVSLQHHIDRAMEKINRNIDALISGINNDSPKSTLLKCVEKISLESKKISSIVQYVDVANFNVKATTIKKDLNRYIREYIENVHQEYEHLKLNKQLLNVELNTDNLEFDCSFRPIEIAMIIDNLFSNSFKAKAKNVFISLKTKPDGTFEMTFEDDGPKGIPDENLPRIFNLGFTTTDGSGIGLYHVKQMVEKMKGEISVNNKIAKGVQFIINIKSL